MLQNENHLNSMLQTEHLLKTEQPLLWMLQTQTQHCFFFLFSGIFQADSCDIFDNWHFFIICFCFQQPHNAAEGSLNTSKLPLSLRRPWLGPVSPGGKCL